MMQPLTPHLVTQSLFDSITQDQVVSAQELSDLLSVLPHIPESELFQLDVFLQGVASGQLAFLDDALLLLQGIKKNWSVNYPKFYKRKFSKISDQNPDEGVAVIASFLFFSKNMRKLGVPENIFECFIKGNDDPSWFIALSQKTFLYSEKFRESGYQNALYTEASKEDGIDWLAKCARNSPVECMWFNVQVCDAEGQTRSLWFEVGKNCAERSVDVDEPLVHTAYLLAGLQGTVESACLYHTHPQCVSASAYVDVVYEQSRTVPEILSVYNDLHVLAKLAEHAQYFRWPVIMANAAVSFRGVFSAIPHEALLSDIENLDLTEAQICQAPVVAIVKKDRQQHISTQMIEETAACYSETTGFDVRYEAFEIKRTSKIRNDMLGGLRALKADYPMADCYCLYGVSQRLHIDGIEVVPVEAGLKEMGELL